MSDKRKPRTENNPSPSHVPQKRLRSPLLSPASSPSIYKGSHDSDIHNNSASKRHCPEEKPADTSSTPSNAAPQTATQFLPVSQNQSDLGIVQSALSEVFTYFDQCREERKEQLLLWEKNGILRSPYFNPCPQIFERAKLVYRLRQSRGQAPPNRGS
jgi:hypothetical protein